MRKNKLWLLSVTLGVILLTTCAPKATPVEEASPTPKPVVTPTPKPKVEATPTSIPPTPTATATPQPSTPTLFPSPTPEPPPPTPVETAPTPCPTKSTRLTFYTLVIYLRNLDDSPLVMRPQITFFVCGQEVVSGQASEDGTFVLRLPSGDYMALIEYGDPTMGFLQDIFLPEEDTTITVNLAYGTLTVLPRTPSGHAAAHDAQLTLTTQTIAPSAVPVVSGRSIGSGTSLTLLDGVYDIELSFATRDGETETLERGGHQVAASETTTVTFELPFDDGLLQVKKSEASSGRVTISDAQGEVVTSNRYFYSYSSFSMPLFTGTYTVTASFPDIEPPVTREVGVNIEPGMVTTVLVSELITTTPTVTVARIKSE